MSEVKIQTVSNHLANKLSFTFFQDKIITIAEDSIMNVYNAKSQQLVQKFDLDNEFYAIASNSIDKIAFGGEKQQVDLHTLVKDGSISEKFDENVLSEPYLAMKFQSAVQRLHWVGKYILGFSEDFYVQLYNSETEKVIHFKPGHEGSVKNGAIDPLGEFLATSGCDGQVIIYKIPQSDEAEVEVVKKLKITKTKTVTFDKNPLSVQWTPDGSMLLVSGEPALATITRNEWTLNYSTKFTHKSAISCVQWVNDTVLATASLDKVIKIWNFTDKTLLHHASTANEVLQMAYCQKNKCFAYVDYESNLGIWNKEFQEYVPKVGQSQNDDEQMKDEVEINDADDDLVNDILLSQDQEEVQINTDSNKQPIKSQQTNAVKSQQSVMKEATQDKAESITTMVKKVTINGNEETAQKGKTKVQQIKSNADEIIDIYPQQAFIPNCQYDNPVGKHRILAWNMVGTVCIREELQFVSVDVDFANKTFHRNLVFNDDYGASMAAINYSGMVLASKGEENDLDSYEEDDIDDDMEIDGEKDAKKLKQYSHLYYKPFSNYKSLKDWHYKLDKGENIECLAIGTNWCAVYTDLSYLRVFSGEGIQKYMMCLGTPIVSMTGYENLLSIVYHSGPGVFGCQALKVKTIDMNGKHFNIISDIECPISRYSNLTWIGYSEEGQLHTYDNEGIMRMLNPVNNQWIPAIDFRMKCRTTYNQLWIVGISEGEVLAIELPKGYAAPPLNMMSLIRRFKLKVPFLDQEKKDIDSKELTIPQIEEEVMRLQQLIELESYRKDNWEQLKHFRSKYDNEHILSETIMDNTELINKKKEVDKLLLNAIRMSIISDDHEKAFTYMDMFYFTQSLNLCIKLCNSLNASELSQKISKFISEKEQKDIMMDSYKKSNQTNNTNNIRLQDRKMFRGNNVSEKPDLSHFAINASQGSSAQSIEHQSTENANSHNLKITMNVQDSELSKNSNNSMNVPTTQTTQQPKAQASNNPFLKKPSVDLAAKKTTSNGNTNDIFKDLSDTKKPTELPTVGNKRPNPFAQENKNPSKQKKLK